MYQFFHLHISSAVTYLYSRRREVWALTATYCLYRSLFLYQFRLGGSIRRHRGIHCGNSGFSSEASTHRYGTDLEHFSGLWPTGQLQAPPHVPFCMNCCANRCTTPCLQRSWSLTLLKGCLNLSRVLQATPKPCQPRSWELPVSARSRCSSLGFPWLRKPPCLPQSSTQPRILPLPRLHSSQTECCCWSICQSGLQVQFKVTWKCWILISSIHGMAFGNPRW